jgi:hypothetical protein
MAISFQEFRVRLMFSTLNKTTGTFSRYKSSLIFVVFITSVLVAMVGWLYFLGGIAWRLSMWTFALA